MDAAQLGDFNKGNNCFTNRQPYTISWGYADYMSARSSEEKDCIASYNY